MSTALVIINPALLHTCNNAAYSEVLTVVNSGLMHHIIVVCDAEIQFRDGLAELGRAITCSSSTEKVFECSKISAFNDEMICQYIEQQGITEVYLCGADLVGGVYATAIDMKDNGLSVKIMSKCCHSSIREANTVITQGLGAQSLVC